MSKKSSKSPTSSTSSSSEPPSFYFAACPTEVSDNPKLGTFGEIIENVLGELNQQVDTGLTVTELLDNLRDNAADSGELETGQEYEFGVYEVRLIGRYKISQPPAHPLITKL